MRQVVLAVLVVSATSCSSSGGDGGSDATAFATKSDLDALKADQDALKADHDALAAKLAFLDQCKEGDALVRDGTGWACTSDPACPPGFAHAADPTFTICKRTVGTLVDEVVKVGDFWIDRYEFSACAGGALSGDTGDSTTTAACSTAGQQPQVNVTWFQASQMCANAGKHLCTNAEWQTAVAGTVDPGGATGTDGKCNTLGSANRATGLGTMCQSRFGAEDMIGNVEEWVSDWLQAGPNWTTTTGLQSPTRAGNSGGPWPLGFGNDWTVNINGSVFDSGGTIRGLPAAPIRGGYHPQNEDAGAFYMDATFAPTWKSSVITARCCIHGR